MVSEEITRMAQPELQSCETERQKSEEIKEVSSDEILSDEDDEQLTASECTRRSTEISNIISSCPV